MPGRQVRLDETVVAEAKSHRAQLGFAPDAPDGVVLSELAREGLRTRLEASRRRERIALYAEWAQERDLHESVVETAGAAIRDGVA